MAASASIPGGNTTPPAPDSKPVAAKASDLAREGLAAVFYGDRLFPLDKFVIDEGGTIDEEIKAEFRKYMMPETGCFPVFLDAAKTLKARFRAALYPSNNNFTFANHPLAEAYFPPQCNLQGCEFSVITKVYYATILDNVPRIRQPENACVDISATWIRDPNQLHKLANNNFSSFFTAGKQRSLDTTSAFLLVTAPIIKTNLRPLDFPDDTKSATHTANDAAAPAFNAFYSRHNIAHGSVMFGDIKLSYFQHVPLHPSLNNNATITNNMMINAALAIKGNFQAFVQRQHNEIKLNAPKPKTYSYKYLFDEKSDVDTSEDEDFTTPPAAMLEPEKSFFQAVMLFARMISLPMFYDHPFHSDAAIITRFMNCSQEYSKLITIERETGSKLFPFKMLDVAEIFSEFQQCVFHILYALEKPEHESLVEQAFREFAKNITLRNQMIDVFMSIERTVQFALSPAFVTQIKKGAHLELLADLDLERFDTLPLKYTLWEDCALYEILKNPSLLSDSVLRFLPNNWLNLCISWVQKHKATFDLAQTIRCRFDDAAIWLKGVVIKFDNEHQSDFSFMFSVCMIEFLNTALFVKANDTLVTQFVSPQGGNLHILVRNNHQVESFVDVDEKIAVPQAPAAPALSTATINLFLAGNNPVEAKAMLAAVKDVKADAAAKPTDAKATAKAAARPAAAAAAAAAATEVAADTEVRPVAVAKPAKSAKPRRSQLLLMR